ncbi:MAG: hypothetical protein QOG09_1238 [Solirubrobacterales bacterium]|nr:hypothetical protein [Solirubrobacterales bacterium]
MPWIENRLRDSLLLEAVARGDAEAADLFFAAYAETIYGALLKLFPNAYDSAEALRRVVLAAIERAGEFPNDGRTAARSWLLAIVAEIAGVGRDRLAELEGFDAGELADLVERHPLDYRVARETARHLRPLGGERGDGVIVARGTSAQVQLPPQGNLLELASRAILKLSEDFSAWREREATDLADSGTGGIAGELADPQLTPTIGTTGGHHPTPGPPPLDVERLPMPAPTPSTGGIRAPQRTPSTETLRIWQRPRGDR